MASRCEKASAKATVIYTQNGSIANAVHNEVDHDGFIQSQIKGALKMRSIKIMGLCLVAVFVMSAVAVATASALTPTFLFPGGGSKPQFSSTSGEGKLVTKIGEKEETVECASDTDTGEIIKGTDKVQNVLVVFAGCKGSIDGDPVKCTSASLAEGQIKTNQLEGDLGYIKNTEPREVGLVLKPEASAPEGLFAEFTCADGSILKAKIKVKGEVIGKIEPINKLVTTKENFTLKYEHGTSASVQQYTSLEVLGVKQTGLLLLTKIGTAENFEFSGIKTEDKIFALESAEISA